MVNPLLSKKQRVFTFHAIKNYNNRGKYLQMERSINQLCGVILRILNQRR